MRNKIRTLVAIAFCLPGAIQAQETSGKNEFAISAQIRPRAEYRNGALNPRDKGEEAAAFINNRARLSLAYKRSDLSMKISAQHVGVWGQDPLIDKNGRFILNEAWARIHMGTHFFAQVGRQTFAYDDERILGGLDWNVAGRYHDALKLGYQNERHQLHAIVAFNQNDERINGGTFYDNSKTTLYKNMQTLWYHYRASTDIWSASLLVINLGQEGGDIETQTSNTQYLQTMGTYLEYKPARWNLTGSFYYQTGKNRTGRSVSAYMGSIRAHYKVAPAWAIQVGTDYLSGNKQKEGTYKAFDPLYGTHHKFYGAMDYFYATGFINGYAPGLSDNQIGVTYKVSPKVQMALTYHYFATGVKLEGINRTLGSELDYQLDCKLMKDVSLSAGYSFMRGTHAMDIVKGGDHTRWQDWGWLSLNINPQLFFTKW